MNLAARMKDFFGVQDMTQGKPMTGLLKFSIPLLIGNLAQQMYNTVDSIVVGQYVGDVALAAVGTAGPVLNLLFVLFMGISTGASILTAQFFGAKDRQKLSSVVATTIFLILASGLLMTFVGYFASPFLIGLVTPPPEVAEGAIIYLQIIFIGIIGNVMYNILCGVLRGMGDSMYPLIYLLIACFLNIALDLLFVAGFGMGIAGVAWATILAQAVSGVLCIIRLTRMKETIDLHVKDIFKPDLALTLRLGKLGLPAGITQAIFSLSTIVVQALTNTMGTAMIAANVAIMRVDGFAMMPNFTFGTAATTYIGQNVGAKNMDRVRRGTRDLLWVATVTAAVLVGCIVLFGHQLMRMFTQTPEVIELGMRGLYWLAIGYIVFAVSQVLQGVMRGAGDTMVPMWISIICTVALRLPLAYLLAHLTKSELWPTGHPDAIFSSLMVCWVLGTVMSIVAYKMGLWRRRLPKEMQ